MNNFIPYEKIISLPPLVDFRDPNQRDPWKERPQGNASFGGLAAFANLGGNVWAAQQHTSILNDLFGIQRQAN